LSGLEGTYAVALTAPGYLQRLWDAAVAGAAGYTRYRFRLGGAVRRAHPRAASLEAGARLRRS
jgi:hypothetical protein